MSLELEEVSGTGDVFEDFLFVFRRCLAKVNILNRSVAGSRCTSCVGAGNEPAPSCAILNSITQHHGYGLVYRRLGMVHKG